MAKDPTSHLINFASPFAAFSVPQSDILGAIKKVSINLLPTMDREKERPTVNTVTTIRPITVYLVNENAASVASTAGVQDITEMPSEIEEGKKISPLLKEMQKRYDTGVPFVVKDPDQDQHFYLFLGDGVEPLVFDTQEDAIANAEIQKKASLSEKNLRITERYLKAVSEGFAAIKSVSGQLDSVNEVDDAFVGLTSAPPSADGTTLGLPNVNLQAEMMAQTHENNSVQRAEERAREKLKDTFDALDSKILKSTSVAVPASMDAIAKILGNRLATMGEDGLAAIAKLVK